MMELIKRLLLTVETADPEASDEADLWLAMIIERHSPRRDQDAFYERLLLPEVMNVSIDDEERAELVAELGRILLSDRVTPRLVWALGKSWSSEALRFLVAFIRSEDRAGNEDCLWEALMAAETFFSGHANAAMTRKAVSIARERDLLGALDRIAADCGADTSALAKRIAEKLSSLAG